MTKLPFTCRSHSIYIALVLPLFAALGAPAIAQRTVSLTFANEANLSLPETLETRMVRDQLQDPQKLPESKAQALQLTERVDFQVPAGRWKIELTAEEFWFPTASVPDGKTDLRLEVPIYPTSWLRLLVLPAENETLPATASAFFSFPSIPSGQENSALTGSLPCQVEGERWHCPVPVGFEAVRLQAPGYVPHFWSDNVDTAGAIIDVGSLQLRRGGKVSGQVVTADGLPLDPSCQIEASLQTEVASDTGKLPEMNRTTAPDLYGQFSIEGLSPGAYWISARQPGSAPARVKFIVRDQDHQELDQPLVLEATLDLEVAIEPATDPDGQSWQLMLLEQANRVSSRVESAASDGRHRFSGLEPGTYTVVVSSAEGLRLAEQTFDLSPENRRLDFELQQVTVEGQLTLGGAPLAADLYFGGLNKLVSVRLTSDSEGRFSGHLPRSGDWDIDIRSSEPQIFRRLRQMAVEVDPSSETASLALDLPGDGLRGEVVDEDGAPVAGATLLLAGPEGISHLKSKNDGSFGFAGLSTGGYVLEAQKVIDGSRWQSEATTIDLEPENSPWIRLEIEPARPIKGSITSANGPIAGAKIQALPLREGGFGLLVAQSISDAEGAFELELSAHGKVQITIMAPGMPLHRQTFKPDISRQLTVSLSRPTGTLRLQHGGYTNTRSSGRRPPWIVLNGETRFDYPLLKNWSQMNQMSPASNQELAIPLMPSGAYEACWSLPVDGAENEELRTTSCVQGLLLPGKELVLGLAKDKVQ